MTLIPTNERGVPATRDRAGTPIGGCDYHVEAWPSLVGHAFTVLYPLGKASVREAEYYAA